MCATDSSWMLLELTGFFFFFQIAVWRCRDIRRATLARWTQRSPGFSLLTPTAPHSQSNRRRTSRHLPPPPPPPPPAPPCRSTTSSACDRPARGHDRRPAVKTLSSPVSMQGVLYQASRAFSRWMHCCCWSVFYLRSFVQWSTYELHLFLLHENFKLLAAVYAVAKETWFFVSTELLHTYVFFANEIKRKIIFCET